MKDLIVNYENVLNKYSERIKEIEAEEIKIKNRITRAEKQLEDLEKEIITLLSPDFEFTLVIPLAKKLAEYFGKHYILQSSFDKQGKEYFSIHIVDDITKSVKEQPTFSITVCEYKCADGYNWIAFDTGYKSRENGKRKFALLPTKFEEVVKLVK